MILLCLIKFCANASFEKHDSDKVPEYHPRRQIDLKVYKNSPGVLNDVTIANSRSGKTSLRLKRWKEYQRDILKRVYRHSKITSHLSTENLTFPATKSTGNERRKKSMKIQHPAYKRNAKFNRKDLAWKRPKIVSRRFKNHNKHSLNEHKNKRYISGSKNNKRKRIIKREWIPTQNRTCKRNILKVPVTSSAAKKENNKTESYKVSRSDDKRHFESVFRMLNRDSTSVLPDSKYANATVLDELAIEITDEGDTRDLKTVTEDIEEQREKFKTQNLELKPNTQLPEVTDSILRSSSVQDADYGRVTRAKRILDDFRNDYLEDSNENVVYETNESLQAASTMDIDHLTNGKESADQQVRSLQTQQAAETSGKAYIMDVESAQPQQPKDSRQPQLTN